MDIDVIDRILQMIIMDTECTFVQAELINNGVFYTILESLESIVTDNGTLRLHYTTSVGILLLQLTLLSLDQSGENLRRSTSILRYTTWLLATLASDGIEAQIAVSFVFAAGIIFAIAKNLSEVMAASSNQTALLFVQATAQFICLILNKLRYYSFVIPLAI